MPDCPRIRMPPKTDNQRTLMRTAKLIVSFSWSLKVLKMAEVTHLCPPVSSSLKKDSYYTTLWISSLKFAVSKFSKLLNEYDANTYVYSERSIIS